MLGLAVVVDVLLMLASSLFLLLLFAVAVACDIHAERHLAKAGGSKCKLRGIPTLGAKPRRSGKGEGLHKRSAEDWGNGLRARGAELPLGNTYVRLSCGYESLSSRSRGPDHIGFTWRELRI